MLSCREGSEHFHVSSSIYELTLNRLQFTNEEFAELAQIALSNANSFGEMGRNLTLPDTLVYWMAWSVMRVASGNRQLFRLTGDAKTLYNQGSSHIAGMSTVAGRCDVLATLTYEKACELSRIDRIAAHAVCDMASV
jgi:hypothetical protein